MTACPTGRRTRTTPTRPPSGATGAACAAAAAPSRWPCCWSRPGSSYADGERGHVALGGVSRHGGELVDGAVVAEDHVAGQADPGQFGDALLVAGGGVDGLARLLGQGDLGGPDDRPGRGRVGQAGVDLEVDVGPAARVAAREDRGEGGRAAGIDLLGAAQVVLVGGGRAVEGVVVVAVAVPQVHAGSLGDVAAAGVADGEPDLQGHPLGGGGRGAEAGADVAADDAGVVEHVGAVGAVGRVGAGGLLGDLGEVAAGVARGGAARGGAGGAGGAAGGQQGGGADAAEQAEHAAPVDQGAQVVDEPAVGLVDLVAVLVEPAFSVGRGAGSGAHGCSSPWSRFAGPGHGVGRPLPAP